MTSERDLGPQPIGELLVRHGLTAHDLVTASDEQLTHKMVARAVKGRRLTPRVMWKVQRSLNAASGESYELDDLFDYAPSRSPRALDREALESPDPVAGASSTSREASYSCPSCGESIVVPLDVADGSREYVEDCPVCCSPVVLRIDSDDGEARIHARAE